MLVTQYFMFKCKTTNTVCFPSMNHMYSSNHKIIQLPLEAEADTCTFSNSNSTKYRFWKGLAANSIKVENRVAGGGKLWQVR
jgi:hypothetical protein